MGATTVTPTDKICSDSKGRPIMLHAFIWNIALIMILFLFINILRLAQSLSKGKGVYQPQRFLVYKL